MPFHDGNQAIEIIGSTVKMHMKINPTPTPTMSERFDEKFKCLDCDAYHLPHGTIPEHIKAFIASEISLAVEKEGERIAGEIEKAKGTDFREIYPDATPLLKGRWSGWEDAMKQAAEIARGKK